MDSLDCGHVVVDQCDEDSNRVCGQLDCPNTYHWGDDGALLCDSGKHDD